MKRDDCRSCGSVSLNLVYDFGELPLAGNFARTAFDSIHCPKYRLELYECSDCGLLQILELPPIEQVFHADYKYSTGTIPALVSHFQEYANYLSPKVPRGSAILEFGCNDGTLLTMLEAAGHKTIGVDPSANVANLARAKGLRVITDFFCTNLVCNEGLLSGFDLVTCSNVFAHIDTLSDVTAAAWRSLKQDGLFCVEVHDADLLIAQTQFDTVYHEHLTYFSERTLSAHLRRNGFDVVESTRTSMHGGGLRILARKVQIPTEIPLGGMGREDVIGVCRGGAMEKFSQAIERCHADILHTKSRHGKIWGYGAAGRSQMFINMTNTASMFEAVFDDSPLRQNSFIIGTAVPILAFDHAVHGGACVILAWNYADSIVGKVRPHFDEILVALPALEKL